jgi:hypothetical protein
MPDFDHLNTVMKKWLLATHELTTTHQLYTLSTPQAHPMGWFWLTGGGICKWSGVKNQGINYYCNSVVSD